VAALVCAVGFATAVAGCSSEAAMPQVAFPSATVNAQIQANMPVTPAASYTGYAPPLNAITTRISGIPSGLKLTYPMSWQTFTVQVANTSTFDFVDIEPLVVLGQCTCNPDDYNLAPHTALQLWDAATNAWKGVQVSVMGKDGTYKYTGQVGTTNLGPKASLILRFRMAVVRTTKETGLKSGTGSLDVFVLQLPKHTRLSVGDGPDATVPLAYSFN
jgi:hypothetical protein